MSGTALVGALALMASPASAQEQRFELDLPSQPLDSALRAFARQSKQQLIFTEAEAQRFNAPSLSGSYSAEEALETLLAGTSLEIRRTASGAFQIAAATGPQSGSAAGDGAEVEALIVTAQKKEEDIQDVPIAISAFTQEALEAQKIEGGFDLLKAIPNVTFSKNNFSSYNFSIRGIGTKAISVTTDPGVSVAFNASPIIRNRLFEQEYYDVERVEVLRGPQGTLYGRNATAGVINLISAKPEMGAFDGSIKVEVGNHQSRRGSGYVNVPIVADKLALRVAGAFTQREGFGYNELLKERMDGRDLWSARLTARFQPTERLRADLIWEHFSEDDDRARTSKQLCHRDAGPTELGGVTLEPLAQGFLSQGCRDGSLYDAAAYGTPNGLSIPFILSGASGATYILGYDRPIVQPDGSQLPNAHLYQVNPIAAQDPYNGMMQSPDLRTISSQFRPIYRAKADVLELNVEFNLTDALQLISQTVYVEDEYYSSQDYNRFNTVPVFNNSSGTYAPPIYDPETGLFSNAPSELEDLTPGGLFCDPQLGCSRSIAGLDISRARSTQFGQELRLQSAFDGNINFSVGANYLQYKTVEDYFVLFNLITQTAMGFFNRSADPGMCRVYDFGANQWTLVSLDSQAAENANCMYVDTNPIESIDGEGHNYFRSKNPYRLRSAAIFGELYWEISEALKLTAGLRYTDDRKISTPVPSQALLSKTFFGGLSETNRGYPARPDIKQNWREFSGRVGLDYKPDLSFTDDTMLYAFYSRGYKGGGANPPPIGYGLENPFDPSAPPLFFTVAQVPETFEPEFVNAFEVGTKNVLLQGALVLNTGAFYYDYEGYQVSKIVDRTAANENFDATVWGLELESVWRPTDRLRINLNLGYQDSELAEGSQSIDLMNRTQGDPNFGIVKPFVQLPSNCVVPMEMLIENAILVEGAAFNWTSFCPGSPFSFHDGSEFPNRGAGLYADLSGNELPNTPHWTQSLGVQYVHPLPAGWEAMVRADFYHQSQSWARVYEAKIDKLHGWTNTNVVVALSNPDEDLEIEVYVKNVFDETPITDAFLNSDDTALTTNVFTLDPRQIGLSITKGF